MITQKILAISLLGTEWIIYLLILVSIFSWAIILDKLIFLNKKRGSKELLNNKLQRFIKQGDQAKTLQGLKDDPSSPASVATQLLTHMAKNGKNPEDYLAIALSEEKLKLEGRIVFLGTIVSTAPFLGLLGTVLGIINAFHGLAINKQGGDIVMSGISEALVATALGLFIAIPAAAAYNYFVRMIKKILVSSENFSRFLLMSFPSPEETRNEHAYSNPK